MPRIRNDAAYERKRSAILDIAERLIQAKGYDSLAITDLISEAGISKGAFYHYFTAKRAVLAALLDRRLDRWEQRLAPIADSGATADRRLRDYLRSLAGAKGEDRSFLIDVLGSVYAEENVLVHAAARRGIAERLLPQLTRIIDDGRADTTFTVVDPEATARVVVSLLQECTDRIGRLLIDVADGRGTTRRLEQQAAAYVEALHRTLGAAPGSLSFIAAADLRRWARAAREAGPARVAVSS